MNARLKKKDATKVDMRIPCAWMKKNANLPKNVMAVRKAVIDEGKDAVLRFSHCVTLWRRHCTPLNV